ncbi:MAG: hypothetical protein KC713_08730 [Candidatus Omnitrophica bacterium]|nr:hypothetical protein [Candidatus Omnitrophota bacterium]
MIKIFFQKTYYLCLLGAFLLFAGGQVYSNETVSEDPVSSGQEMDLLPCEDPGLDLIFYCNPRWEIQTEDNLVFAVILKEPNITMTITRSTDPINSLDYLTDNILQDLGSYATGYRKEIMQLDIGEAVHVWGLHQKYRELYLEDYYFVKDDQLYSVLFSVNPAEQMGQYKPLLDKIVQNIHPLSTR